MGFALFLLLPALISVALIRRGLRGVAIDDHPLCRKCGFDLFGSPAGTRVCGECGCSLNLPGRIVIGHRRRRASLIWAGSIIAAPILLTAAAALLGEIQGASWLRYAPVSLLERMASSASQGTRQPALAELNSRWESGRLTDQQLSTVIETGLKYQGDLKKPWDTGWGDLLEAAKARGKLSAKQASTYLSQSVAGAVVFRARARLRITDPLPYSLSSSALPRVGNGTVAWLAFDSKRLQWPGQAAPARVNWPRAGYIQIGSPLWDGSTVEPRDLPGNLSVGLQQLHYVTDFGIGSPARMESGLVPTWVGKLDLSATVDVEPNDHPTVKLIHDPALADRVRHSLRVILQQDPGRRVFMVEVENPPVGLGFSISIKGVSGDREVGRFACIAGTNCDYSFFPELSTPLGKTEDVVLRSDAAAAAGTVDTFEIWDGEIVFKDVQVK